MSRLIDADALIEAWRKKHNIGEDDCGAVFVGYTEIPRLIDEQPTVDAVPVIRCKDCMWWLDSDHTCHEHSLTSPMTANEFCSRAERRSDV